MFSHVPTAARLLQPPTVPVTVAPPDPAEPLAPEPPCPAPPDPELPPLLCVVPPRPAAPTLAEPAKFVSPAPPEFSLVLVLLSPCEEPQARNPIERPTMNERMTTPSVFKRRQGENDRGARLGTRAASSSDRD